jgi:hypothetical protein
MQPPSSSAATPLTRVTAVEPNGFASLFIVEIRIVEVLVRRD